MNINIRTRIVKHRILTNIGYYLKNDKAKSTKWTSNKTNIFEIVINGLSWELNLGGNI